LGSRRIEGSAYPWNPPVEIGSVASCEFAVVYAPVNVSGQVPAPTEQSTVLPADATALPVPVSVTVCGEPVALSVNTRLAVAVPEPVGVNVTLTAHDDPVTGPHVFVCAKELAFAPVIAMLVKFTTVVPVLVATTYCTGDVVPTFDEKLSPLTLSVNVVVTGGLTVPPLPPELPPLHPVKANVVEAASTNRVFRAERMGSLRVTVGSDSLVHPRTR
jgi:hypothetical protein